MRPTHRQAALVLVTAAGYLCFAAPARADIDVSRLLERERQATQDTKPARVPQASETDTPTPPAGPAPAPLSDEPASQGDPEQMYERGVALDRSGAPEDLVQAAQWYRKAAELGHVDAQINLGVMLSEGLGVPKDEAEAVRWFTRAAQAGNPRGEYSLALMYYHGSGVERDYAEAIRLYVAAAGGGSSSAMNNLGIMYGLGEGVERDNGEAYAWFALAALLGDVNAAKNRDLTADELSEQDLARAQDRFFELKDSLGLE